MREKDMKEKKRNKNKQTNTKPFDSCQMQGAIQEAVYNSNPMIWLINPAEVQFLNIHIHRDNIVQDTITQLMDHRVTDYKRPLKVIIVKADLVWFYGKGLCILVVRCVFCGVAFFLMWGWLYYIAPFYLGLMTGLFM